MVRKERHISIIHLYLIRHGKTIAKNPNLIFGQTEISLSSVGKSEMKRLSKTIDGHVQQIFTSPLNRALESAQILSRGKIPIDIKKELLEINFGRYGGKDVSELPKVFIDKYKSKIPNSKPFPNGESINQVRGRILKFHRELMKSDLTSVCVISHQWVLNNYLKLLVESNLEKGASFIFQTGKITHVKISRIDGKTRFMAHNIDYFDTYK